MLKSKFFNSLFVLLIFHIASSTSFSNSSSTLFVVVVCYYCAIRGVIFRFYVRFCFTLRFFIRTLLLLHCGWDLWWMGVQSECACNAKPTTQFNIFTCFSEHFCKIALQVFIWLVSHHVNKHAIFCFRSLQPTNQLKHCELMILCWEERVVIFTLFLLLCQFSPPFFIFYSVVLCNNPSLLVCYFVYNVKLRSFVLWFADLLHTCAVILNWESLCIW